MNRRFILASNNLSKLKEMQSILSQLGYDVMSQKDAGLNLDVQETGTTFLDNALLKAEAVVKATGGAAIADDSGLVVEALNGEPGVYSARYGGENLKSDKERYEYLLKKMEGIKNRRAMFVTEIACVFPDGRIITCRGECHGTILTSPRGDGGFGYDPVFLVDGGDKTMAEMSACEKNAISHRGKAINKLIEKLRESI